MTSHSVSAVDNERSSAKRPPVRFDVAAVETPAFFYDQTQLASAVGRIQRLRSEHSCSVLYSLKPFSFTDALSLMVPHLDGLAASSLFEVLLAREVLGDRGSVHITSPGIKAGEFSAIGEVCDYIAFNSISQWESGRSHMPERVSCGLRVNPQQSWVEDDRYDPCRRHSKLGVPLDRLSAIVDSDPELLADVKGILFHSNCDSTEFGQLLATVHHLQENIGGFLDRLDWINLGGGYLFEEAADIAPLAQAVDLLSSTHELRVFIEPGAGLVRSAGFIVSAVVDLFDNDGMTIAVLDTTVNHMPEVFEYGFEPDVLGHSPEGEHEYLLAGATCLAGDLLGAYRFDEPLEVGSRVVFENAGAYTLSKAHMFNGVNLPTIYALTERGELVLKRRFTYEDFAERWRTRVPVSV